MKRGRVIAILIYLSIVGLCFSACNSNYTLNKKRGYFKIPFPEKKYQQFDRPGYPYTFEYPVYATVVRDSTFFETRPENDYWINIDFPQLNGRIYISYKEIGKNNFDSLVNDSYTMAYRRHTEKATSIEPVPFTTANNVEGVYFTLTGNTATANQFFVTDTTRHFLRGAIYFEAVPNEDSISVVNDFVRKDLMHLINTLKWR